MRTYWRHWDFWKWWWEERVSGEAKFTAAVLLAVGMAFAGFMFARNLSPQEEAATTFVTKRVVTLDRKKGPPKVVTQIDTVTQPAKTKLLTVQRDGRTIVIHAPGETETLRGPVRERVITKDGRISTVVRTDTADRVATVTTPGRTETVTTEVTQPQRTVTDTDTVTVTNPVTVTIVTTVTTEVTTTETVTETHGKP